ncbi:nicotinate-nucleotide adenylyltransferase [Gloeocapsa sp. PCC 73106]|uniref:nicotinate-nucleotide adenylyltransferase n=1 Tax=Gloeocapsa sp. PCC 73106 TaxID=102232 RepID=UPI00054D1F39|nr:nicotinate-nucleotide adenylyltransferase [Gloeocapsa sp. PCC 73106]
MLKIALFGTSADPPTAGHQEILIWLSQNYDQVGVWASDNPFKQHQTSLAQRLEMLGLLIEEISTPRDNIVLREELSDRRSLISVNRARVIWGEQAEYSIVIGSDLVRQIQSWYNIQELLQKVKILIVPRLGYQLEAQELASLSNLGGDYSIAEFQVPPVSSSSYRQNGDQTVLTQSIANYITKYNLYQL